ncbi:MAG: Na/Pi cotransporter family protein [Kiritimatiellales bacterium]|nr:Na/Pi cotransporter family protein [Kiritimatiellota bacterium]MBL7012765.1 Na/Pi cotransporter family protein [Kiritimatiellales bacterium]
MKYMSEGMQAVAGDRLRKIISKITDRRVMGLLVGLMVTCIVQSSSVTTVMVVGLVNSSIMTLTQAIGVIFGANIGTTITGWLLTLKIGKYGLPMLAVAAFFFLFSKNERLRYTGMTIMGIGMIFYGLEMMSSGFKPLRSLPEFVEWFHAFQATSYLGVLKCALVGCVLTMIVQSSSATLGITMGMASQGLINFETAGALVLGENIGTTVTAFLASLGTSTNARRAAYAHIVFNLIGVVWITAIALPLYFPIIGKLIGGDPNMMVVLDGGEESFPHIMAAIAMVHTGFNVTNSLIFLPFVGLLAKLVTKMVPDKGVEEVSHLTYLDVRMLDTPALGIVQSGKQIQFMGESVELMLEKLDMVLKADKVDDILESKIFKREEILDNVQKEIMVFLGELISGQVPHEVMETSRRQMRMADEYESISDYAASVLKGLCKLRDNNLELAPEGIQEFIDLNQQVLEYIQKINRAVLTEDEQAADDLIANSGEITRTMKNYRQQHLSRLAEHKVSSLSSLVYTDILNNYRRMKDHALNIAEVIVGEK